jgi:hypothetical protein
MDRRLHPGLYFGDVVWRTAYNCGIFGPVRGIQFSTIVTLSGSAGGLAPQRVSSEGSRHRIRDASLEARGSENCLVDPLSMTVLENWVVR